MKYFKNLRSSQKHRKSPSLTRVTLAFMHIKFFAYKDAFVNRDNYNMVEIMAVLEGFEVYADRDKNFCSGRKTSARKSASSCRAKIRNLRPRAWRRGWAIKT